MNQGPKLPKTIRDQCEVYMKKLEKEKEEMEWEWTLKDGVVLSKEEFEAAKAAGESGTSGNPREEGAAGEAGTSSEAPRVVIIQ